MPETFKEYPVMELTICIQSQKDLASRHERMQEGDIINVRRPSAGTGLDVPKRYLKILVEGLELDEFQRLKEPIGSGFDDNEEVLEPYFDKRRFCIPLELLGIDLNRAQDVNDCYQPKMLIDKDSPFMFFDLSQPIFVFGFIFDKLKGEFI